MFVIPHMNSTAQSRAMLLEILPSFSRLADNYCWRDSDADGDILMCLRSAAEGFPNREDPDIASQPLECRFLSTIELIVDFSRS